MLDREARFDHASKPIFSPPFPTDESFPMCKIPFQRYSLPLGCSTNPLRLEYPSKGPVGSFVGFFKEETKEAASPPILLRLQCRPRRSTLDIRALPVITTPDRDRDFFLIIQLYSLADLRISSIAYDRCPLRWLQGSGDVQRKLRCRLTDCTGQR